MVGKIKTHPLKWETLRSTIELSGMENPDVWIEDVSRYGRCSGDEAETTADDTDCIEASFSMICDYKKNRVIIRHHY